MNISFEDFKKVEIRIGKVLSAEPVEKSEKLLRLQVDFGVGEEGQEPERRQILSGIAQFYQPDELVGMELPFITNLEPRMIMGIESQGMLLAGDSPDGIFLLRPNKEVSPGSRLK